MTTRTLVLFVLLLAACKRSAPAPLGSLKGHRAAWQADCPNPLREEAVVRGPDFLASMSRMRKVVFDKAAKRLTCEHPGWALYYDNAERIVGLCVDDQVVPEQSHLARAAPLLLKHLPAELVHDMTNRCAWEPEHIKHGLVRWYQRLPFVRDAEGHSTVHPPVNTLTACCWEVRE
jgi:hypothetical protein